VNQECLKQLLRYMVQHPEAMDTVEGIREWWLRDVSQTVSENTLVAAIEELESKDWLIRRDMTGLKTLYRINPSKLEEIRELLQTWKASD
jgi:DNA-binding PadR family transcriptional regulator